MRKPKKYHYIYKITRTDGKYYIGLHSTNKLDDGYFGSGKRLWYSINKYGKEVHTKEIIEFLPDRETLKKREAELVNEECLQDPLCMNLCVGGGHGWDYVNNNMTEEMREKRKEGVIRSLETRLKIHGEDWAKKFAGRTNDYLRKNKLGVFSPNFVSPFRNPEIRIKGTLAATSEKAIQKRKETYTKNNHQQGEKNSQFGTMWITDGISSMKVRKDADIPLGWCKGRTVSTKP